MNLLCFPKLVYVDCENMSPKTLLPALKVIGKRRTQWLFFGCRNALSAWHKAWICTMPADMIDRGSFFETPIGKDAADKVIERHALDLLWSPQQHSVREVFLLSSDAGFKTMKVAYKTNPFFRLTGIGDARVCRERQRDFEQFFQI